MSFFMLETSDLVFPADMAEEVMELVQKGTTVSQHWKTKEFTIESTRSSNTALVPFSAASMAQAVLNKAASDEEAKNA
jgi:hypothetical protein